MNLQTVKSYVMKPVVLVVLLAGVCGGGGYLAGRYTAPDKVVTKEKVVTQVQTKVVTQVQTQVQVVHDVQVQHDIQIKTVTVRAKDGSEVITTTKEDHSKSEAETKADEKKATQTVAEQKVYIDREVTKTVERLRPQWSLALQPGFSLGTSQYNLLSAVPVPRLMATAVVERRILGPVFVGAWASTHLDGGLSIRAEF